MAHWLITLIFEVCGSQGIGNFAYFRVKLRFTGYPPHWPFPMSCAFLLLSDDPVCFTLKIPMTPCTRTTAKYSRSPRSTWHGRKAAENIAQQINGWEWFHRDVPFFIRNPPPPHPPLPIIKDDMFLKWVLGFFLQRREQNFDPLNTNFSKMLTKNEPFDFHCSNFCSNFCRQQFEGSYSSHPS